MTRKSEIQAIREAVEGDISKHSNRADSSSLKKRYNHLLKVNQELRAALDFKDQIFKCPVKCDPWDMTSSKFRKKVTKASPAVALSDWHVEERVDLEKTNGRNEYNLEIAARRIRRVMTRIPEYCERYCPMGKVLYVGVLGDMINGWIHDLRETNLLTPIEAGLEFEEHFLSGLSTIRSQLKSVGIKKVVFIPKVGNHGRTTVEKRDDNECETSYEWSCYHHCQRMLRTDPFYNTWLFSKAHRTEVEIHGHVTRWHHGHEMPGGKQMVANVNRKIEEINQSEPRRADCDIFGHHHHYCEADNWVCNSSLVGFTGRSEKKGYRYEEPSQTFIVFSENRCKHHCVRIFADD